VDTNASLQGYLDSLSQVPGSILYRDTFNWTALLPGSPGQALSLDENLRPMWTNVILQTYLFQRFVGTVAHQSRGAVTTFQNWTVSLFFKVSSRAGTSVRGLFGVSNNSVTTQRIGIFVGDASHATAPNRIWVRSLNNVGAELLNARPSPNVADNQVHHLFASFDANTGNSTIRLDRVAYTPSISIAGSLNYTASFQRLSFTAGISNSGINGDIGAIGFKRQYRTNWSDFVTDDIRPIPIDETSWSAWGGQPDAWNYWGELANNKGSNGVWDRSNQQYLINPYA